MEQLNKFLNCLFEPNEFVCATSSPKGTEVKPLKSIDSVKDAFFSINPLYGDKDMLPTESYHSASRPRRADHNVSAFRNILVEMDKISIDEQAAHMKEIKFPFSSCVFSGKKSYHWIISLQTSLSSRQEYIKLVKRVYKAVGNDKVDHSCKNPSRFSRLPFHLRAETGLVQQLRELKERINNDQLEAWLLSRGVPNTEEPKWDNITNKTLGKKNFSALYPSTKNFLAGSYVEGTWNITLFKAAADICRNGWSEEEALDMLLQVTGTLDIYDKKTIHSAFINEENNGQY